MTEEPRVVVPRPTDIGTCSLCRFWEGVEDREGHCHFSAPTSSDSISSRGSWPVTLATDWCGQWAARAI